MAKKDKKQQNAQTYYQRISDIKYELIADIERVVKKYCKARNCRVIKCEGIEDFEECHLYPELYDDSTSFRITRVSKQGIKVDDLGCGEKDIQIALDYLNVYDLNFIYSTLDGLLEEEENERRRKESRYDEEGTFLVE